MAEPIEFRVEGLDEVVRMLQRLPPELVSRRGGPVLRSLLKAGRVIRDQAKRNVAQITQGSVVSTGALRRAIVVTRGRKPPDSHGERVIILVRKSRSPGRSRTGVPERYGLFVEGGTKKRGGGVRMAARPWLAPAFLSKRVEAVEVFRRDILQRVSALAERLVRGGT